MDNKEKAEVKKVGAIKATGIKTIQVKAKDAISIRGKVVSEMQENNDMFFADRYFCDKYHVSNQQINQLMRQLERQGSIERVRPQVPDPYGQLPIGRRIMNRWKE